MENQEQPSNGVEIAENYIETSLVASRETLKKTRIFAAGASVFMVGYLAFVTATFHQNLEPEGAATVATGLASQRIDDLSPTFASYIHEQVPQIIRHAPDEIIARMPEMREQLETRVEDDLRAHSAEGGKKLSAAIGQLIADHKDEIAAFAKDGQDPQLMDKVGDEMQKTVLAFIHDQEIGGTTIAAKLDHTLDALRQVSSRTGKLASNKGLTSSEQKARHAVALLMRRIQSTPDDGTVETAHRTVSGIATSFQP